MKTITSISLDTELKAQAKQHINNLSGEIEEFLRVRIAQLKGNTEEFNKLQIENKLKKLNQESSELRIEIKTLNDKLIIINQEIEKKQNNELQREKEIAQKILKCVLCGGTIEGKKRELAYTDEEGREFYHHSSCWLDKYEQHKWKDKEEYLEWLNKRNQ
ncbi:MAG: hypothetical protein ACTSYG_07600 [Candidatus Heimdallarchaeota archaeon]